MCAEMLLMFTWETAAAAEIEHVYEMNARTAHYIWKTTVLLSH